MAIEQQPLFEGNGPQFVIQDSFQAAHAVLRGDLPAPTVAHEPLSPEEEQTAAITRARNVAQNNMPNGGAITSPTVPPERTHELREALESAKKQ
jgi:hypothetical protein